MPVMAKKKPATVPTYLRLPKAIKAAMESLAEENRRTLTAEIVLALESHLKESGRELPKDKPRD